MFTGFQGGHSLLEVNNVFQIEEVRPEFEQRDSMDQCLDGVFAPEEGSVVEKSVRQAVKDTKLFDTALEQKKKGLRDIKDLGTRSV